MRDSKGHGHFRPPPLFIYKCRHQTITNVIISNRVEPSLTWTCQLEQRRVRYQIDAFILKLIYIIQLQKNKIIDTDIQTPPSYMKYTIDMYPQLLVSLHCVPGAAAIHSWRFPL